MTYFDTHEVVQELKNIFRQKRMYYKFVGKSPGGSYYIYVRYKEFATKIRVSDHSENSRKLPEYNVLVRHDIPLGTISRTGKRYFAAEHITQMVTEIIDRARTLDERKKKDEDKS